MSRPLCLHPWFDPRSPHDRRLLLRDDASYAPVEVDTLEGLRASQDPSLGPRHATLVYQQWGREIPGRGRPFFWLDAASAEAVGKILAGGPTRELLLVVTKLQPGALARFAQASSVSRKLEMLGILYYFSGDDLTDDPEVATEIAETAQRLGLKRVSILTALLGSECEGLLAAGLKGNRTLERLEVFQKDDAKTWPRIATPAIDAALRAR